MVLTNRLLYTIANYGENAAVFFNDAINVLNNKLAANGGSVQVGVLKDVSLVTIKLMPAH